MKAILIDTTSQNLCLVLIDGEKTFASEHEVGKSGHSKVLMPYLDELLSHANVKVDELDTIGVVVGPGSFTGIRIGVATATALAFSLNAKRIAITSFELLAYSRKKASLAVDAGHGNLYVAECENGKVVSTDFIDGDVAKTVNRKKFEFEPAKKYSLSAVLALVAKEKAEKAEYVQVFEPYYMRKSQAEREKGL
ncbi:MAG: tRNA (adenosine(37)-N6)-threonylcarbamoyltransferase complex dimerization subunit type 1 TsaB [Clostridia bacterium]|nr:tRNA (adenosine(37)-N6)-threonylcarbamoyltransferase complex dimerization subunit type 1 TsaB [Clostridia bacterium]